MDSLVSEAASQGATLIVFPEYAQSFQPPFSDSWLAQAETLGGPFVTGLQELSAKYGGVLIVAGMLERDGDTVYNTLVAVNSSGLVGSSRKIHLFDAFDYRESDFVTASRPDRPQLVSLGEWHLGLQTCFDIRFPEVSRRLVDQGANVLVVPSQWVPGEHKMTHWLSLLTARAIESQSWVVAVDHPAPHGIGASVVIDPNGEKVVLAGDDHELHVVSLDLEVVAAVKQVNPMERLRRFDVTWRP